jgi:hypothetical protein
MQGPYRWGGKFLLKSGSCWNEKTMIKAFRQVFDLQTSLLAARPKETSARIFWGGDRVQQGQKTKNDRRVRVVEINTTSGVTLLVEGRQKRQPA